MTSTSSPPGSPHPAYTNATTLMSRHLLRIVRSIVNIDQCCVLVGLCQNCGQQVFPHGAFTTMYGAMSISSGHIYGFVYDNAGTSCGRDHPGSHTMYSVYKRIRDRACVRRQQVRLLNSVSGVGWFWAVFCTNDFLPAPQRGGKVAVLPWAGQPGDGRHVLFYIRSHCPSLFL